MKKILSTLIIGFLCLSMFHMLASASSEPPVVEWNRTYGGSSIDEAKSIIQTIDGGYALAGWTNSYGAGGYDFWLVKTDTLGNVQWNRTYGSTADEWGKQVVQTSDNGYAFVGTRWNESRRAADMFMVKTDASGNLSWELDYIPDSTGGSADWGDTGYIIETAEGDYVICGSIRHHPLHSTYDWDAWVVKVDVNGHVQWDKPYYSDMDDGGGGIMQTADGGFVFVGATMSWGGHGGKIWLVKIDADGNQQWVNTYGGEGGPTDNGYSVIQTIDEGYMIAGLTYSFGVLGGDFCLIKTDSLGNEIWFKTYGGTDEEHAHSMVQTNDGGYLLAGHTKSFGAGESDFWLVKTDSSGSMEWNQTQGGAGDDQAWSIVKTGDGGYAVVGCTYSFGAGSCDLWLIKLTPEHLPPPSITAIVDISPDTLNLWSKGKWITAFIELPEGYNVNDINAPTILLNSTIPVDPDAPIAIGDCDEDGIPDLMVKFDRAMVISYILANVNLTKLYEERFMTITLTIAGHLNDGTLFQGSDTIKIILCMSRGLGRHIFPI